ncbi:MAG: NADP-dependent oxidoreductase [Parachlamydiaceae bacterium]|nr:NADP-dependent oxidoreductase [Parachlamydiaceae bacterium]
MNSHHEQCMKAIVIEKFGGPEELMLKKMAIPEPNPGEVQIRISYAAVNPVDWKIRQGHLHPKIPHQFPIILGWDASGTISKVGQGVDQFKVGDEVFAYCRKPTIQWGTYAEYVCLEAENVAHKPTNLSFAQAAAFPLSGLTAWQSLFDVTKIKEGDSVLIQAGAGGVGSLAIQFAKIAGATVFTTGSESNHTFLKRLGADIVIDYRNDSIEEIVKNHTKNGLDIIFDTIGGEVYRNSYKLLKRGGKIVSLLEQPNKELEEKYGVESFYVFVVPNGNELEDIANLIQEGKVVPIPIHEFPLEKAAEAHESSQEGHVQGKIVLKIM